MPHSEAPGGMIRPMEDRCRPGGCTAASRMARLGTAIDSPIHNMLTHPHR